MRKIGSRSNSDGKSYGKLINGNDVRCELMVIAESKYKTCRFFSTLLSSFSLFLVFVMISRN